MTAVLFFILLQACIFVVMYFVVGMPLVSCLVGQIAGFITFAILTAARGS